MHFQYKELQFILPYVEKFQIYILAENSVMLNLFDEQSINKASINIVRCLATVDPSLRRPKFQ